MPMITPQVPDGLIDLMKELTKCIIRDKPENIHEYAARHFEQKILERDGALDKGYESFTDTEQKFKGAGKFDVTFSSKFQCKNSYKFTKQNPLKLRKNQFDCSIYMEEKFLNAIYTIQKYFRRHLAKVRKDGGKKQLTEETAAIIIQRTLRKVFQGKKVEQQDGSNMKGGVPMETGTVEEGATESEFKKEEVKEIVKDILVAEVVGQVSKKEEVKEIVDGILVEQLEGISTDGGSGDDKKEDDSPKSSEGREVVPPLELGGTSEESEKISDEYKGEEMTSVESSGKREDIVGDSSVISTEENKKESETARSTDENLTSEDQRDINLSKKDGKDSVQLTEEIISPSGDITTKEEVDNETPRTPKSVSPKDSLKSSDKISENDTDKDAISSLESPQSADKLVSGAEDNTPKDSPHPSVTKSEIAEEENDSLKESPEPLEKLQSEEEKHSSEGENRSVVEDKTFKDSSPPLEIEAEMVEKEKYSLQESPETLEKLHSEEEKHSSEGETRSGAEDKTPKDSLHSSEEKAKIDKQENASIQESPESLEKPHSEEEKHSSEGEKRFEDNTPKDSQSSEDKAKIDGQENASFQDSPKLLSGEEKHSSVEEASPSQESPNAEDSLPAEAVRSSESPIQNNMEQESPSSLDLKESPKSLEGESPKDDNSLQKSSKSSEKESAREDPSKDSQESITLTESRESAAEKKNVSQQNDSPQESAEKDQSVEKESSPQGKDDSETLQSEKESSAKPESNSEPSQEPAKDELTKSELSPQEPSLLAENSPSKEESKKVSSTESPKERSNNKEEPQPKLSSASTLDERIQSLEDSELEILDQIMGSSVAVGGPENEEKRNMKNIGNKTSLIGKVQTSSSTFSKTSKVDKVAVELNESRLLNVKSRNVSSKIDSSQKISRFGNIDQKILSDGSTYEYFEIPNLLKSGKLMEKGDESSFHDSLEDSDVEDDSLNYIQSNIPNISFFSGNENDEVHRDFEDDDSENHLETITEEQESDISGRKGSAASQKTLRSNGDFSLEGQELSKVEEGEGEKEGKHDKEADGCARKDKTDHEEVTKEHVEAIEAGSEVKHDTNNEKDGGTRKVDGEKDQELTKDEEGQTKNEEISKDSEVLIETIEPVSEDKHDERNELSNIAEGEKENTGNTKESEVAQDLVKAIESGSEGKHDVGSTGKVDGGKDHKLSKVEEGDKKNTEITKDPKEAQDLAKAIESDSEGKNDVTGKEKDGGTEVDGEKGHELSNIAKCEKENTGISKDSEVAQDLVEAIESGSESKHDVIRKEKDGGTEKVDGGKGHELSKVEEGEKKNKGPSKDLAVAQRLVESIETGSEGKHYDSNNEKGGGKGDDNTDLGKVDGEKAKKGVRVATQGIMVVLQDDKEADHLRPSNLVDNENKRGTISNPEQVKKASENKSDASQEMKVSQHLNSVDFKKEASDDITSTNFEMPKEPNPENTKNGPYEGNSIQDSSKTDLEDPALKLEVYNDEVDSKEEVPVNIDSYTKDAHKSDLEDSKEEVPVKIDSYTKDTLKSDLGESALNNKKVESKEVMSSGINDSSPEVFVASDQDDGVMKGIKSEDEQKQPDPKDGAATLTKSDPRDRADVIRDVSHSNYTLKEEVNPDETDIKEEVPVDVKSRSSEGQDDEGYDIKRYAEQVESKNVLEKDQNLDESLVQDVEDSYVIIKQEETAALEQRAESSHDFKANHDHQRGEIKVSNSMQAMEKDQNLDESLVQSVEDSAEHSSAIKHQKTGDLEHGVESSQDSKINHDLQGEQIKDTHSIQDIKKDQNIDESLVQSVENSAVIIKHEKTPDLDAESSHDFIANHDHHAGQIKVANSIQAMEKNQNLDESLVQSVEDSSVIIKQEKTGDLESLVQSVEDSSVIKHEKTGDLEEGVESSHDSKANYARQGGQIKDTHSIHAMEQDRNPDKSLVQSVENSSVIIKQEKTGDLESPVQSVEDSAVIKHKNKANPEQLVEPSQDHKAHYDHQGGQVKDEYSIQAEGQHEHTLQESAKNSENTDKKGSDVKYQNKQEDDVSKRVAVEEEVEPSQASNSNQNVEDAKISKGRFNGKPEKENISSKSRDETVEDAPELVVENNPVEMINISNKPEDVEVLSLSKPVKDVQIMNEVDAENDLSLKTSNEDIRPTSSGESSSLNDSGIMLDYKEKQGSLQESSKSHPMKIKREIQSNTTSLEEVSLKNSSEKDTEDLPSNHDNGLKSLISAYKKNHDNEADPVNIEEMNVEADLVASASKLALSLFHIGLPPDLDDKQRNEGISQSIKSSSDLEFNSSTNEIKPSDQEEESKESDGTQKKKGVQEFEKLYTPDSTTINKTIESIDQDQTKSNPEKDLQTTSTQDDHKLNSDQVRLKKADSEGSKENQNKEEQSDPKKTKNNVGFESNDQLKEDPQKNPQLTTPPNSIAQNVESKDQENESDDQEDQPKTDSLESPQSPDSLEELTRKDSGEVGPVELIGKDYKEKEGLIDLLGKLLKENKDPLGLSGKETVITEVKNTKVESRGSIEELERKNSDEEGLVTLTNAPKNFIKSEYKFDRKKWEENKSKADQDKSEDPTEADQAELIKDNIIDPKKDEKDYAKEELKNGQDPKKANQAELIEGNIIDPKKDEKDYAKEELKDGQVSQDADQVELIKSNTMDPVKDEIDHPKEDVQDDKADSSKKQPAEDLKKSKAHEEFMRHRIRKGMSENVAVIIPTLRSSPVKKSRSADAPASISSKRSIEPIVKKASVKKESSTDKNPLHRSKRVERQSSVEEDAVSASTRKQYSGSKNLSKSYSHVDKAQLQNQVFKKSAGRSKRAVKVTDSGTSLLKAGRNDSYKKATNIEEDLLSKESMDPDVEEKGSPQNVEIGKNVQLDGSFEDSKIIDHQEVTTASLELGASKIIEDIPEKTEFDPEPKLKEDSLPEKSSGISDTPGHLQFELPLTKNLDTSNTSEGLSQDSLPQVTDDKPSNELQTTRQPLHKIDENTESKPNESDQETNDDVVIVSQINKSQAKGDSTAPIKPIIAQPKTSMTKNRNESLESDDVVIVSQQQSKIPQLLKTKGKHVSFDESSAVEIIRTLHDSQNEPALPHISQNIEITDRVVPSEVQESVSKTVQDALELGLNITKEPDSLNETYTKKEQPLNTTYTKLDILEKSVSDVEEAVGSTITSTLEREAKIIEAIGSSGEKVMEEVTKMASDKKTELESSSPSKAETQESKLAESFVKQKSAILGAEHVEYIKGSLKSVSKQVSQTIADVENTSGSRVNDAVIMRSSLDEKAKSVVDVATTALKANERPLSRESNDIVEHVGEIVGDEVKELQSSLGKGVQNLEGKMEKSVKSVQQTLIDNKDNLESLIDESSKVQVRETEIIEKSLKKEATKIVEGNSIQSDLEQTLSDKKDNLESLLDKGTKALDGKAEIFESLKEESTKLAEDNSNNPDMSGENKNVESLLDEGSKALTDKAQILVSLKGESTKIAEENTIKTDLALSDEKQNSRSLLNEKSKALDGKAQIFESLKEETTKTVKENYVKSNLEQTLSDEKDILESLLDKGSKALAGKAQILESLKEESTKIFEESSVKSNLEQTLSDKKEKLESLLDEKSKALAGKAQALEKSLEGDATETVTGSSFKSQTNAAAETLKQVGKDAENQVQEVQRTLNRGTHTVADNLEKSIKSADEDFKRNLNDHKENMENLLHKESKAMIDKVQVLGKSLKDTSTEIVEGLQTVNGGSSSKSDMNGSESSESAKDAESSTENSFDTVVEKLRTSSEDFKENVSYPQSLLTEAQKLETSLEKESLMLEESVDVASKQANRVITSSTNNLEKVEKSLGETFVASRGENSEELVGFSESASTKVKQIVKGKENTDLEELSEEGNFHIDAAQSKEPDPTDNMKEKPTDEPNFVKKFSKGVGNLVGKSMTSAKKAVKGILPSSSADSKSENKESKSPKFDLQKTFIIDKVELSNFLQNEKKHAGRIENLNATFVIPTNTKIQNQSKKAAKANIFKTNSVSADEKASSGNPAEIDGPRKSGLKNESMVQSENSSVKLGSSEMSDLFETIDSVIKEAEYSAVVISNVNDVIDTAVENHKESKKKIEDEVESVLELAEKAVHILRKQSTVDEPECIKKRVSLTQEDNKLEDIDISKFEKDSLEAMYYSLKKNDIMVDRMQRRASEQKIELNSTPKQLSGESVAPLDFESIEHEAVEGSADQESSVAPNIEEETEVKTQKRPSLSLIKMHTIAGDMNFETSFTSEEIRELDKERSLNKSLDELTSENIRLKMRAYSVSFESNGEENGAEDVENVMEIQAKNMRDDFNISTALEPVTSTDTDSSIVSAVTKIQARTRGFLTRKRLRSKAETYEPKASFGNGAISESLENLVEEEAAKKIQNSYRSYKANKTNRQIRTMDDCEIGPLPPSLAARRLTLQRGDAVQNYSNPEDEVDSGTSKLTPKQKADKWMVHRQNSMPVQIDSAVLRFLPKKIKKRIKSAEMSKKKAPKKRLP